MIEQSKLKPTQNNSPRNILSSSSSQYSDDMLAEISLMESIRIFDLLCTMDRELVILLIHT